MSSLSTDSAPSPVGTQNLLETNQAWREHCQEQSGKFKRLQGAGVTKSTENRAGCGALKDMGDSLWDRFYRLVLDQLLVITPA